MDETTLRNRLTDLNLPALRYFDTVGSTNDIALEWVLNGAPDLALVVADQQQSGRGRLGRQWVTRPNSALALSLVIRPTPDEVNRLALFSPLAAVALHQVLTENFGLPVQIKWPNDVLVDRKKVSGILVEVQWEGQTPLGLVLGIGINIAPSAVPPTDQLLFPATSIEAAAGRQVDRLDLLHDFLAALLEWRPQLGSGEFFQTWEDNLAFLKESVRIESGGQQVYNGTVQGIDPDGNLRLLEPTGNEVRIAAGDVRLRPSEGTSTTATEI
ncbi:MAG: biotin--[acetyl-CoA-carboxylase] ligase [Phycisphaerales bacterium]|nr:biotin--[acetyl-CoA-carboxylase] ligase [Phycisphaerales bacterium]